MGYICAVIGCSHRSDRDNQYRFFSLPTVNGREGEVHEELLRKRRRTWLANIFRPNIKEASYKFTRVCSDHFVSGAPSYIYDQTNPDWAPTLNLGRPKVKPTSGARAVQRTKRLNERKLKKAAQANVAGTVNEVGAKVNNPSHPDYVPSVFPNPLERIRKKPRGTIQQRKRAPKRSTTKGVSSDDPTNPGRGPVVRMSYDEEQALENSVKKKKTRQRNRRVGFPPVESEELDTESTDTDKSTGEEIHPDSVPATFPTTSKSGIVSETKTRRFSRQRKRVTRKGTKRKKPSSPDYVPYGSKRPTKILKRSNKGGTATKKTKRKLGGNASPSVLYVSVPRAQKTKGKRVPSSGHSDIVEVALYEEDCGSEAQTQKRSRQKDSVSTTVQMLLFENQQLKDTMSAVDLSEVSFRQNDEKTKVYTGLTTFTLLVTVFDLIRPSLKERTNEALTPFQQLLLTLMKLRLGVPLHYLSYVLKVQYETVQSTFSDVIHILNAKLVPLILFWPQREQIRSTMPYVFQDAFPKCVSIIDCFEVLVERSAASDAKWLQNPNGKSPSSMKYLLSVTPQGFVSFVSQGRAGCTSDRLLTQRCGYLRNLAPGDTVLAHRDFSVEDVVAMHGAELQIPEFPETKELSYREILETRSKVCVRKHIERMTGNVRENYSILQSRLPVDYLQSDQSGLTLIDQILRVACGLCNICDSVVPFDEV